MVSTKVMAATLKTSVYLPPDLNAVLRSRAKQRGVSIQDVIREALTLAMDVEDGGRINDTVEEVRTELKIQRAEIAGMQARLEALQTNGKQSPAAAETSEAA